MVSTKKIFMTEDVDRYLEKNNGELPGIHIERGLPHPLGATPDAHGVNFCVFTDHASSVELLLFVGHDDPEPSYTIRLDPMKHRTFQFWHVYVRGIHPGMHYAYRVDGYADIHQTGSRFNRNKVLIDPYSRGNTDVLWNRVNACGPEDNSATSMRSVIIDTAHYDWEGDHPLHRPMNQTIIYEMHVRGFTKSPTSHCQYPGTFIGVIEKIPYLKELGITAVELLPIFDFDQKEVKNINPLDGQRLVNYWGYDPISFFAPASSYCVSAEAGMHLTEFRDMVKALHRAGIEVILDVVFNHTSEGDHRGPVIKHKGFSKGSYYLLSSLNKEYYMNYSGCGNTIYGNHPITEKLIIDALVFWVKEMHVDGFRFDEAVILCRDENGVPMVNPPVIWQIELADELIHTKVIAEAWDAAGLYEVGFFPGFRWGEWNGRYRDAIRSFVRGDMGYVEGKVLVGRVADVIAGSADIFERAGELPINSVNFITAHDGFTLNDLVSYNGKHNEANGEFNRDGNDNNLSWNCGVEGETDIPEVEQLRIRQCKNFMTILMLSQGVPMFVAGDEVRRTQRGNNNAYCQDNELNWFDWTLVEKNHSLLRFHQRLIAFRRAHPLLQRVNFFTGRTNERDLADISWHGTRLYSPGWNNPESRVLAFTLGGFADEGMEDVDIHVMMNMEWEDLKFDIPAFIGRKWYRVIDTFCNSPDDIAENILHYSMHMQVTGSVHTVKPHSIVVLVSNEH